jgi:hypothetical protein
MATTSSLSGVVNRPATAYGNKQAVRARVTDLIKQNFANTLGQATDIINIFMALIQKESSFNVINSKGPNYGPLHLNKILQYSAINNKYSQGTTAERVNITNSAAAYGLCQVTGYYCIRGCSSTGVSELEKMRPDLASPLIISPGDDVTTKLWGENNLDNQLLAGLIVLEDKYKNIAPRLVSQGKYSNRLTAAVAAYLGLGAFDSLGTTPEAYANSIIRGSAYQIANNGKGPDGKLSVASGNDVSSNKKSANGPSATAASGNNLSVAGC